MLFAFWVAAIRKMYVTKRARFDGDAFYAALDGERQARHYTWKRVAEESGVSASTLTRFSQGKRPDVDGLASLSAWSGLDVDRFFRCGDAKKEPEPLALISSYLRSDPRLNVDTAIAIDQMVKAAYRSMSGPDEETEDSFTPETATTVSEEVTEALNEGTDRRLP